MENALISIDKLKKRGFIHYNVEDGLISPIIIAVQDSIVEPLVGTTLFKRLLQGINDSDLKPDEIILMDKYVVPVMVSGCNVHAVNIVSVQVRNKGAGKFKDEKFEAVSHQDKIDLKNQYEKYLKIYERRLVGYLRDNCQLYPQYNEAECSYENIKPNKKISRGHISLL